MRRAGILTLFALAPNLYAFEVGTCPELVGQTFDGEPVDVGSFQGKVVILEFWATWCAPCVTSLKHAVKLAESKDVQVLAVNSEPNPEKSRQFLERFNIDLLQVWDSQMELLKSANPSAMPYTVVLDKSGCVVWRGSGAHPKTLESIKSVVWFHAGGKR